MLGADVPKPAAAKLFTVYLNDNRKVGLYQCYNQHHYLIDLDSSLWFCVQTAATAAESWLVWEDEICSIWF